MQFTINLVNYMDYLRGLDSWEYTFHLPLKILIAAIGYLKGSDEMT